MKNISLAQRSWLNLLSCALNGKTPDRELLTQTSPQEIYRLAELHSMLAVTAFALNMLDIYEPHFEQAKAKALRKLALFEAERKSIYQKLNQAGISFCPLKGIFLMDCYPVFGMREMTDNDILCDFARMADVREIMESLGYECKSYGEEHHDVYTKEPCLEFEMHRSLFNEDKTPDLAEYYADVFDKLKNSGGCEYSFTDEDFYIYMLAHEYKHFSHNGTGIRSLADVYVYLKAHPDLDREYLSAELAKLKLTDFEQHSRELSGKVFGGAELNDDDAEELLNYYLDSSLYGSVEKGKINRLTRSLDGRDNKGAKAKYFLNRFFLSGEELEKKYPFYYKHKALLPVLYIYRPIKGAITHPKQIMQDAKRLVKYNSPKHKY